MDVRYRCCKHCGPVDQHWPAGHVVPCARPGCPGRMPIDPDTEG